MNDTTFSKRKWSVGGRVLSFKTGPKLMAILNVTPDSFSDGGRFSQVDSALRQVEVLVAEGAEIIDIGGESTRPGAARAKSEVELERVIPVISAVSDRFDVVISVDTTKSVVAAEAIGAGADIVNDISGLRFDPKMAEVVAKSQAGIVVMHSGSTFETMHETAENLDIVEAVRESLKTSIETAKAAGIEAERICVDIGIGFGKTLAQNLRLLHYLPQIVDSFEKHPMLVGVSRKSFIGKLTGEEDPAKRLSGTIAANSVAVLGGADILRVHDVKAAADAVSVVNAIRNKL